MVNILAFQAKDTGSIPVTRFDGIDLTAITIIIGNLRALQQTLPFLIEKFNNLKTNFGIFVKGNMLGSWKFILGSGSRN